MSKYKYDSYDHLAKRLREAAENTAPSKPPCRPEQTLYFIAAEAIESLLLRDSQTYERSWMDDVIDDVSFHLDTARALVEEMSVNDLLNAAALVYFRLGLSNATVDLVRDKLNKPSRTS